jgi:hypothetical protein
MKSILLLLIFAASVCVGSAQTAKQTSDHSYRMGDREVSIPPPDGFVEATTRSEALKKVFEATESPALDLLAIHVPTEVMDMIARGEHRDLGFYTKVSVSKSLRVADSSAADFSDLVSYFRANSAKMLDFKRPEMQSQLDQQNKSLTELLKQNPKLDLSQPANLGEIESTPNSYGFLLLLKMKFQIDGEEKEKLVVSGVSLVRVRNRIVWIYTYRTFNSESDAAILRAFTKRWLADIVRANAE